ncbi:type II toxin-antitoxin system VapC family toxin [Nostoc sp. FACHB-87]|nr:MULTISPECIES: type II toxin-antitoxin system VapC family toxin [Nostocaceae]MBD2298987.1 type II toxin-antitoxin system VapC family toxin [Nostoc sp. FACHB-190]MBD2453189.1 type II toxin-antitoxin system VapC family toxin [Nostoc sp. FACHB-87]MBD2475032.1 type II toxin-antitoxin system VapC family toxin [Anabaena sp. FACHB-83]
MSSLCDTNIISELTRPKPNPGVISWIGTVTSINLSVITVEEIYYGLTAKPNVRIQAWFENFLTTHCEILPITSEIAQCSGELRGFLRTQGQPRAQADMLIAATAKIHSITLVTRNIKDFEGCGISTLNPFI